MKRYDDPRADVGPGRARAASVGAHVDVDVVHAPFGAAVPRPCVGRAPRWLSTNSSAASSSVRMRPQHLVRRVPEVLDRVAVDGRVGGRERVGAVAGAAVVVAFVAAARLHQTNSTTSRSSTKRAPATSRRTETVGQHERAPVRTDGQDELVVGAAELDVVALGERQLHRQQAARRPRRRRGTARCTRAGPRRRRRRRGSWRRSTAPACPRPPRSRARLRACGSGANASAITSRWADCVERHCANHGWSSSAGKDPVRDDRVDVVPEQREVRERAACFGDDEPLGVDDEPCARDVAVGEQLADAVEPIVEAPDGAEHGVARDRDTGDALQHRPSESREPSLRVEHPLHVPTEDVGQRQQADRLRGRRAVDDHEVVVAARRELLDVGEREHLVEARARPRAPRLRPRRRRPSRARRRGRCARRPMPLRTARRAFSCWPDRRCAIGVGRSPSGVSNASASECAGSVEHTIVRRPCSARRGSRSPRRRSSCRRRPCR